MSFWSNLGNIALNLATGGAYGAVKSGVNAVKNLSSGNTGEGVANLVDAVTGSNLGSGVKSTVDIISGAANGNNEQLGSGIGNLAGGLIGGGGALPTGMIGAQLGESIGSDIGAKKDEEAKTKREEQERQLQLQAQEELKQANENAANARLNVNREAREDAISQEEANAKNTYTAMRNTGLNRTASSALGQAATQDQKFVNANNNRALGTSTQNDWLSKRGYTQGLKQQANNLESGAFLNTLGAMFQGAGSGAQTGASLARG